MAEDHNAKNCQQRLTFHPTILHGYLPKVKTDSIQSIGDPECSSKNTAVEENVTWASVNGKFDVEEISMGVVPIKV